MRKSVIKKIAKVVVCSVMALVLTASGVNIPNMHTDENVVVAKAASVRKCFTICNWNKECTLTRR